MWTGIVVGVIILLTCLTFFSSVDKEKVLGWTYFGTWWLGKSEEGLTPLDAHIIYTYPDRVQAGKPFDVGVTLEYINDKSARSSWVLFSNVSIVLRSLELPNGPNLPNMLNTSDHDTSGLLKPGEAYSHSFPIVAPESREKYLVFLRFTAFFSPEGVGSEPWFYFSASDHYNIGKGKPGYISPNELPPITVVDKQDKTNKTGRLVVEIEKPYGIIAPTPINITIDKASWIHLADSFPLSLFFKHNFLGIISTNVSLFTVDGTYRPRYLTSRPFKKEEKVSARACFSIQTST